MPNDPSIRDTTPAGKITLQECVELFGAEMPLAAAALLLDLPAGLSVSAVRGRLHEIAREWRDRLAFNAGYLAGWQDSDASRRGAVCRGCEDAFIAWGQRHVG